MEIGRTQQDTALSNGRRQKAGANRTATGRDAEPAVKVEP